MVNSIYQPSRYPGSSKRHSNGIRRLFGARATEEASEERAFNALVRCDPEEQCEDGKEVNHIPGEPEEIHGAVLLSQVSG